MHDRNGEELKVGDEVTVKFQIMAIHPGIEFCNVDLKSVEPMPGASPESFTSLSAINTRQTEKV